MWLDTSVLVSLYVPEPRSARVARLVRRRRRPDPLLAAPRARGCQCTPPPSLPARSETAAGRGHRRAPRGRSPRRHAPPCRHRLAVDHGEGRRAGKPAHGTAGLPFARRPARGGRGALGQPAFRHGRSPSEPGRPSRGSDHDPIDVGGGAPGPRRRHRAARGVAGEVVFAAKFPLGSRRNRSPISRTSCRSSLASRSAGKAGAWHILCPSSAHIRG